MALAVAGAQFPGGGRERRFSIGVCEGEYGAFYGAKRAEPLATAGMGQRRKARNHAKSVAVSCDRLPPEW